MNKSALFGVLSAACACEQAGPATRDVALDEQSFEQAVAPPLARRYARGEYPLDGLERALRGGEPSCGARELVEFSGERVAFSPAARVVEPFRERLRELERSVIEVSSRVYARVPSAIVVSASYDCRAVSGDRSTLSEHALGNAIDISGFRFAPASASTPANTPVPIALEVGFEVRIERHWKASGDSAERRHARFLHELTRALVEQQIFRTLLGPAHPGHQDHFHFDMAPHFFVNL